MKIVLVMTALSMLSVSLVGAPQFDRSSVNDVLERIEKGSDRFRKSVDDALDNSRLDGTSREDDINRFVRDFENATDRLKSRRDDVDAAEEVLRRAAVIDSLLSRRDMGRRVGRDWRSLQKDLNRLRGAYSLSRAVSRGEDRSYGRSGARTDRRQVGELLEQIENGADQFRRSLNSALDESRLDGSAREDKINDYVRDFERATDRLKSRFRKDRATPEDAEKVLKRAAAIGRLMSASRFSSEAERDWRSLQRDLSRLGALYQVAAKW